MILFSYNMNCNSIALVHNYFLFFVVLHNEFLIIMGLFFWGFCTMRQFLTVLNFVIFHCFKSHMQIDLVYGMYHRNLSIFATTQWFRRFWNTLCTQIQVFFPVSWSCKGKVSGSRDSGEVGREEAGVGASCQRGQVPGGASTIGRDRHQGAQVLGEAGSGGYRHCLRGRRQVLGETQAAGGKGQATWLPYCPHLPSCHCLPRCSSGGMHLK